MKRPGEFSERLAGISGLLLLLILTGSVWGQISPKGRPPGLDVICRIGLRGAALNTLPVPVCLDIVNQTGSNLAPELEIDLLEDVEAPQPGQRVRESLALPNQSRKSFRFCLDLESGQYSVARVRLRQRGKILWDETFTSLAVPLTEELRVLTVDRNANRVPLVNPAVESSSSRRGTTIPAVGTRQIVNIGITPAELPAQDPPLYAFHAVLLSDNLTAADLDGQQLTSLAAYAFAGGLVALPRSDDGLCRKLLASLPLPSKQSERKVPPVTEQPVGAGCLILYDGSMVGENELAKGIREALRERLNRQPELGLPKHLEFNRWAAGPAPARTFRNSLALFGVFLFFTISLSVAPVACLRTRERTRIIAVTVVILVFSLTTAGFGLFMRFSPGEARWLTVTELTDDGGIQTAGITLISAGGKEHRLKLSGHTPQLQMLPAHMRFSPYRYYESPMVDSANQSYMLLADLRPGSPSPAEQSIPITCWGRRAAIARDYWSEGHRLPIRFEVAPAAAAPAPAANNRTKRWSAVQVSPVHPGTITVEITNTLATPLSQCRLTIGIYTNMLEPYSNSGIPAPYDLYQTIELGRIEPGQRVRRTSPLQPSTQAGDLHIFSSSDVRVAGMAGISGRRLTAPDRFSATFSAVLPQSPSLQIAAGDFEATAGSHVVIQYLRLEELPLSQGFAKTEKDYPPPAQ